VTSRLLINPHAPTGPVAALAPLPQVEVRGFHERLPGYAPTPLVELPELAASHGVGRVLVKAEVERMGLPSFKVLGASWATYRLLAARLAERDVDAEAWSSVEQLGQLVASQLGPLRFVTATDGNHGRAVARMARLLGVDATILVPDGTADARIDAIAGEGAEVVVVPGSYDAAVARSAGMADERTLVVSDTSWPGYDGPPRWVVEGYSTIFGELDEQIRAAGVDRPDVLVIPLGVGALGAAAAAHYRAPGRRWTGRSDGDMPVLVGVEPADAACVMAAVEAGEVVEVPGPHRSMMAGLNCGLASPVALPVVRSGFGAFVAVDDDRAADALRTLADAGLDVGETGAAALAGLSALVADHAAALPLADDATVVLLATEGVTDPANFEKITGRPPTTATAST
jgi:diaminopropionate ammonia-lyase